MSNSGYRIADDNFWYNIEKDFGQGGGVYELYCMTPKTNIKPINRLLKKDKKGTLYIGKADSFLDRVIHLKKSLSPDYISSNHECGVRYKALTEIRENFPYEHLYVELLGSSNPRTLEVERLDSYLKEFGELPPLNRNG